MLEGREDDAPGGEDDPEEEDAPGSAEGNGGEEGQEGQKDGQRDGQRGQGEDGGQGGEDETVMDRSLRWFRMFPGTEIITREEERGPM